MLVCYGATERSLNLFGHREIVEYGHNPLIQFHNILTLRSNQAHIVAHLVEHRLIVDINVLIRGIKQVTQQSNSATCLLIGQLWQGQCLAASLLHLSYGVFPTLEQNSHFVVKFRHTHVLSHRTYNHAKALRFNALNELFQSRAFSSRLDFRRYRYLFAKWNQYKETACK